MGTVVTEVNFLSLDQETHTDLTAICFRYLELLLNLQNPEKVQAEASRIRSLDNLVRTYLDRPGSNFEFVQDFLDPIFELLSEEMPKWLKERNSPQRIIEAFETTDAYYIQHLRVRISSYVNILPSNPFIVETTSSHICSVN